MSRRRSPPPSDLQRLDALLRDPSTHAQAEAIPEKKTGRPRAYPPYMWVVFEAAVSIWGSARNVEAQFADPVSGASPGTRSRASFPTNL